MKNKLALLLLLLLVSYQPSLPLVAPVVMNSGFEGDWWSETTFWTPKGGPFHYQYQEIAPPEEWTAWWREGFWCPDTPDEKVRRRPEVRVISKTPDPARVHSGDQALKFFGMWSCLRGGVYQQIAVAPGQHYTAQAFGHSWYSQCSTKPHKPPLAGDCKTPLAAQDWLSVCLDPLGGIDPTAPSVVCSTPREVYGGYGEPLRLKHVQALSNTMTLFLQSNAGPPLKHNDVYWDDVSISESYQVFLPVVIKEG